MMTEFSHKHLQILLITLKTKLPSYSLNRTYAKLLHSMHLANNVHVLMFVTIFISTTDV